MKKLVKSKITSIRINPEVETALHKLGLTSQQLFDKALTRLFNIEIKTDVIITPKKGSKK